MCEILQSGQWDCRGEYNACTYSYVMTVWEHVWKDACYDVNNDCSWRWDLSDFFLFICVFQSFLFFFFLKFSNMILCQLFDLDGVNDFKNNVENIVLLLCIKNVMEIENIFQLVASGLMSKLGELVTLYPVET